jgi:hypothetical protein
MQMDFPDPCTTSQDCPMAPSGYPGKCLDESDGLTPTDSLYHHCYLPAVPGGGYSCWP